MRSPTRQDQDLAPGVLTSDEAGQALEVLQEDPMF